MKTATRYLEAHMVRDLATVTGGRYRRVRVDDKTLDIEVHAPEKGDWVPVRSLSQGTLDLVFLVARLGLVRLVTGDRRPPLVFDDPFVTLDDGRAARALGLLKSVATDFQVIYLTTSPRYDEVADAVVLLDGPTSVDTGADPGPAGTGTPAATGSPAVAGTPAASGSPTATGSPRLNELASGQTITVVLGLLSAIVWGCGDFGGGLLTRRTALFGVVLGSQLVGMAMAFVLALVRGETAMLPADVVWSVLAGLAGGIGISGLYNGLAVGRMGVVAPITAVLAALIPVAAGILLQGIPAPLVVVGIGLAIVAVLLVSRVGDDPDAPDRPSGLRFALIGGVGIGLFSVFVAQLSDGHAFGPLTLIRGTEAALIGVVVLVTRASWRPERRLWAPIAGVGVLDMAGNGAFILAVQAGSLAVAAVLSSLYPVTTVILAAVFLRERVTATHAVGIALAIAAIACIAAGTA